MDEYPVSRIHVYSDKEAVGPIIWWIQRDQRLSDNWAMHTAVSEAERLGQPLLAVFCLQQEYLGASTRCFNFMLRGLKHLQEELSRQQIPFLILDYTEKQKSEKREPLVELAYFLSAGSVITDFNPLRNIVLWKERLREQLPCSLLEVDAHNIIPVRVVSNKQEYAARTIRPKINRKLDQWLHEFALPVAITESQRTFFAYITADISVEANNTQPSNQVSDCLRALSVKTRRLLDKSDTDAKYAELPPAGSTAARQLFNRFIDEKLLHYQRKNDPNEDVVSNLSPYLHFGQISAQRVALEVRKAAAARPELNEAAAVFLEELIVRRELADNFCFYNPNYDNFSGFPAWAQQTLKAHSQDMRPYIYNEKQLENAETHEELWNTAQRNLVRTGSMPGYLRMYWAKKILEWTISPEEALRIAILFNDRYMLDGRDPNGYTGICWSIGGVHDRPWVERPIFGKIRLMTLSGCRRKFDVDAWIKTNS